MLKDVRRTVLAVLLAVGSAAAVPAAASADVPGDAVGALIQYPSPNDCITGFPAGTCGSHAAGTLTGANSVAISPDGKNAYVAATGGSLSTFARNRDGTLQFTTCVKDSTSTEACPTNTPNAGDLAGARSVDISSDGKFVYVAASTATTDSITVFLRSLTTGALTPVSTTGPDTKTDECISEELSACRSAIGLKGVSFLRVSDNSVYAASSSGSTVVRLARDSGSGRLTQGSPTTDCFRADTATNLGCGPGTTPGLRTPTSIALTPDGKSVYVASKGSDAVARFNRTSSDGTIVVADCTHGNQSPDCTTTSPQPGLNGAQAVVATNTNVYVASGPAPVANTGNTLANLPRDPASGALGAEAQCYRESTSTAESATCNTGSIDGLTGADAEALSSDAAFLYVGAATGNDVAEFTRDLASGNIAPLEGTGDDRCIAKSTSTECDPSNRSATGIGGASSLAANPTGPDAENATNPSIDLYVTGPSDNAVAELKIERAPTCPDTTITVQHDQTSQGALPRCHDPNGDGVAYQKVSDPTNGAVNVTPSNGQYTYTPNPGFAGGNDSFTYRANDGHVFSSTALVTVHVPPISADHTPPVVFVGGWPRHISYGNLISSGISFQESANERSLWENELLTSERQLGIGSSSTYNIVLAREDFGFIMVNHTVVLKAHDRDLAGRRHFKVRVRVTAIDANGNTTSRHRTIQVG